MKSILQLLLNLALWMSYIAVCSVLIIWYGRLPKDSPYHFWGETGTLNDLFREIKKPK